MIGGEFDRTRTGNPQAPLDGEQDRTRVTGEQNRTQVTGQPGAPGGSEADPLWWMRPTTSEPGVGEHASRVDSMIGRRVGVWQLVKMIGRGGMGEVYLADRADGTFNQRGAIKIVRAELVESAAERFKRERQTLARLDHPNIARLVDGGISAEGWPYLAMEYVEGVPIDQYARGRSVAECVELCIATCEAVAYAHSQLVVHCDLKPANILVRADGVVKLLDFGIARLLVEDGSSAHTELVAYTPQYASPEQFRGDPLSALSDVYSLGVILFELLSEKPPHEYSDSTPLSFGLRVLNDEPVKPSSLLEAPNPARARIVRGDLDAITLKALRKEPQERYGTAQQVASDLRRYQQKLPVTAASGNRSYRARRFIARHIWAMTATVLVFGALVAGLVFSVSQYRAAAAQRTRAEAHLAASREFTHGLIYDIYDAVAYMPGSLAVRRQLIELSLKHLDRVASVDSREPGVLLDLAEAYRRTGDVQGNPNFANLGDIKGSLDSYAAAATALDKAAELGADLPTLSKQRALLSLNHAHVLFWTSDQAGADKAFTNALSLLSSLRQSRDSLELKLAEVEARLGIGDSAFWQDKLDVALKQYDVACIPLLGEPEVGAQGAKVALSRARCLLRRGDALAWLGKPVDSLRDLSAARAALDRLIAAEAPRYEYQQTRLTLLIKLGEHHVEAKDFAGAQAIYEEAAKEAQAMAASDSEDIRAQRSVYLTTRKLGESMAQQKMFDKAGVYLRSAVQSARALLTLQPENAESIRDLANALTETGLIHLQAKQEINAEPFLREALSLRERSLAQTANATNKRDLAIALGYLAYVGEGQGDSKSCELLQQADAAWSNLVRDKLSRPVDDVTRADVIARLQKCAS